MKLKRGLSLVLVLSLVLSLSMVGFGETYEVQEGDVLWKIAKENGMTYETLAAVNGIENPHMIYAGDVLNVNLVKKFDLLTTNDFHGKMEGGYESGAAKLAAYMEYYKAMNEEGTILLDAGDSFQGSPMSNLLYGEPVVRFYNEMGYTATVVGNHEFDWGIEKVFETMEENNAEYPLLTANVYKDGVMAEWATPYLITEVNGVSFGIIGLTTPETSETAHKDYVGDYTFEDAADISKDMIAEVEAKGAEIVIMLGHIPAYQDRDTGLITGELADLAEAVDGYDAMIGGHSHRTVTGKVNETPLVMGYKHGRMFGHITLYYDTVADEVVVSSVEAVEVRKGDLELEENAVVAGYVAEYAAELAPVFDVAVTTMTEIIEADYNTTSPAGNLLADVMIESSGVDFAFTNAGGIREDIPAGDITVGDLFAMMPFDNKIVTTTMTGQGIVDVLEQGCTLYKGQAQIAGLTFTYDSSKAEYARVVDVTMADGTMLDLEADYTVATNDFLAPGQDGYVKLADYTFTDPYSAPILRDELKKYLEALDSYSPIKELRGVDIAE